MNKPIDKNNCIEVGFIKKTHGIKGEILVSFDDDIELEKGIPGFIFFEVEGLLVPFYIEKMASRGDGLVLLNSSMLESKEKANTFVGCKIYTDKIDLQVNDSDINPRLFIGYFLSDKTLGLIGSITEINDFGGNIVFSVNYNNTEVMVPFADDLFISIDQEKGSILLDCPDGLFDLSE